MESDKIFHILVAKTQLIGFLRQPNIYFDLYQTPPPPHLLLLASYHMEMEGVALVWYQDTIEFGHFAR